MKILHIWDQAGTASVIAKWQRRIGHQSIVIKNSKHDKNKVTEYYGGILVSSKIIFILKSVILSRKYDVIHLHDAWFMPVVLKLLYPKKRIIMHYHGTMIRMGTKETRRKIWERFVDVILVATHDLLEFKYAKQPVYVPNPVDIELFQFIKHVQNRKALIVPKKDQSIEDTMSLLSLHGYDVQLESLPKDKWVLYKDFPNMLAEYEFYVDIPIINGKIIMVHSTTGLQALSMGIKTISPDFTMSNFLPENHRPENVVKLLDEIYSERTK